TLPRTGGTRSISETSWVTSLRLPPVSVQASGIPVASTKRWCLEPDLALSTGLGPVWEPPFSPARGWSRRPLATTRARRRPAARQATAHAAAPTHPPAATRPDAVAGRAAAEAELERQMPPRDPRVQHEQDSLQRLPVRQPLATRIAKPTLDLRQERLNPFPQLIRHDPRLRGHRHPLDLDDGCRRPSSSESRSLHFGSNTKRRRRPRRRGRRPAL